ncbi:putative tetratricopeptide-like helical domain superfamily [Dioscorea sansibarensis]
MGSGFGYKPDKEVENADRNHKIKLTGLAKRCPLLRSCAHSHQLDAATPIETGLVFLSSISSNIWRALESNGGHLHELQPFSKPHSFFFLMPWFSNLLFARLSLRIIHVFVFPIQGWCRRRSYCHLHDGQVTKFSEFVRGCSSSSSSSSSSCLEISARPRHPHPFEYNKLMKAFSRAGQPDDVLRLLDEMRQSNFELDVPCYTTAIDSLVVAQRFEEAEAVFKDMVLSGLAPDVASCTVLWMAGREREAIGVLKLMLHEQCHLNVHTYTPIVQAYCSNGRIVKAKRLVDSMRNFGCSPNTVTYNVLIEGLCKVGYFSDVEKLLEESTSMGWKPDVITYSIYMNGLCKNGDADRAFEQLEAMLEKGLNPNSVTLNILLDCLCQCFKVWEAEHLLGRSRELEWDVNVVNYNTVMSGLCKSEKSSAVLKLLGDMMKKGIDPNIRTFTIVIHSLCRAGKLWEAKFVIERRVFVANVVTYTILMQYFCWEGSLGEVQLLFAKMQVEGIQPNVVTYSVMVDCFCRQGKYSEAIDYFVSSLDGGFSPRVATRLTYGLIRGGKLCDTLNLLEWIAGMVTVKAWKYMWSALFLTNCFDPNDL